ncbi:MAG: hypothetical protein PHC83_01820 [Bacteroidales bacterium]|nr:hypothetical protein [Bacteroidales bacterium]MDD4208984.1 hypothetical protein [Bacteroidales bacterium]
MKTIILKRLKKITLIIFSLWMICSIQVSVAQNENEFAPIGAEWYYNNSIYQTQTFFYRKYTYLKDTTINALSCGIIERYVKDGLNTDTLLQQFIHVSGNKIYEYEKIHFIYCMISVSKKANFG